MLLEKLYKYIKYKDFLKDQYYFKGYHFRKVGNGFFYSIFKNDDYKALIIYDNGAFTLYYGPNGKIIWQDFDSHYGKNDFDETDYNEWFKRMQFAIRHIKLYEKRQYVYYQQDYRMIYKLLNQINKKLNSL